MADESLDKLIGRIQALRAKTVKQGCTEQEALTAAAKVAELLDRYGLSLSELDLRGQSCEGSAVETERKRAGPIDDCVPATAAFFDCRVWGEKDRAGRLRYVFFGLPRTSRRHAFCLTWSIRRSPERRRCSNMARSMPPCPGACVERRSTRSKSD